MAEKLSLEKAGLANEQARHRITALLDEGSFFELDPFVLSGGHAAEVVTGCGTVYGEPVYVFAQDSSVEGGAMGKAQASKIARVYDLAEKTGAPVIGIFDSKGAHLTEGVGALNDFSELLLASNRLSGVVPQIAVIDGVCAGSAAVLASVADILIMTEESELFLTPPFNSKNGNKGTAQEAAANGTVSILVKNEDEAFSSVRDLLGLLPDNNLAPVLTAESAEPVKKDCPCSAIVDGESGVELFADYGKTAKTALARIGGIACGVVACVTGEDGLLDPDSCTKITRFVRLCDAFSVPVVTLADAAGFSEADGSELKNAAMLSQAYSEATTVKITVVTSRAYGAAFVAFCGKAANADLVLALPDATVSALQPQAAVTVLMRDRLEAGENRETLVGEYLASEASALHAAQSGFLNDVVKQDEVREKIISALSALASKRVMTVSRKHSNLPL